MAPSRRIKKGKTSRQQPHKAGRNQNPSGEHAQHAVSVEEFETFEEAPTVDCKCPVLYVYSTFSHVFAVDCINSHDYETLAVGHK